MSALVLCTSASSSSSYAMHNSCCCCSSKDALRSGRELGADRRTRSPVESVRRAAIECTDSRRSGRQAAFDEALDESRKGSIAETPRLDEVREGPVSHRAGFIEISQ